MMLLVYHLLYHMILPRAVKPLEQHNPSVCTCKYGQYGVPPDTGVFLESKIPDLRPPKHEYSTVHRCYSILTPKM